MKKIIVLLLSLLLLSSCAKKVDPIDDNYRVFYQIFVGSFSDSNKDGIGDLKGVINRLDYLNDGNINSNKSLGIQGIWLSPIFKSPSYHKYDVIDYYQIDEKFGTIDDLKKLINEVHKRNVKIILDLPINHTSNEAQTFKDFVLAHQKGDTNNKYYDYYSYASENMLASHTYQRITNTNQYYECNFSSSMPELNLDNQDVRQDMLDVAKYYLDLGVDGFRFDAAKYIYYLDNDKSVRFWKWYLGKLKEMKEDIYIVGEVWSDDSETLKYIKEMNCFNFSMSQVNGYIANAAKSGNVNIYSNYVSEYIKKIHNINPDSMLIPFIANHDTDRAAGYLTVLNKHAHIAANLYILCYGSPFIYYGEEIGLKGTRGAANTDANRRLKMLWGDDDTVSDPEGSTFDIKKQTNGTVKEQINDENSLYNYYRKLIAFRNKYPFIARGNYEMYYLKNSSMGGFTIDYNDERHFLIHNTSTLSQEIDLSSYEVKPNEIIDYIGQGDATFENNILKIGPQTSVILK